MRQNYRGARLPCPLGVLIVAAAFVALVAAGAAGQRSSTRATCRVGRGRSSCRRRVPGPARRRAQRRVARLARPRRGDAARRLLDRRAEGGRARSGSRCGSRHGQADGGDVPAHGARRHPGDERLQPAGPAPRAARSRRSCCSASALRIGEGSLDLLGDLGLWVAPILVAGAYDVRERAMLGDTGSQRRRRRGRRLARARAGHHRPGRRRRPCSSSSPPTVSSARSTRSWSARPAFAT